ncbi:MAG: phosphate ABC transporter permease PstA [Alphaproteobacteria bacterium]
MTDSPAGSSLDTKAAAYAALLRKRYGAETRFRLYGILATATALFFLGAMLISIIVIGHSAFRQTFMKLDIFFDPQVISANGKTDLNTLRTADYSALVKSSLRELFPAVKDRREQRQLFGLISRGAEDSLREQVMANPGLIGSKSEVWLMASDDMDLFIKGDITRDMPEAERQLSNLQMDWAGQIAARDDAELRFNTAFLTTGDSREPETAGIWGAVTGSFYTLVVTMVLSFPIGIMAALYLQEFAPKNTITELIEVNINNLAAVPSIVFGLLGLAVFLNFLQMPRSAPLVGGIVLALMTLPTIIIAARAAILAIPPSIREAALAVGASPMQTALHHVIPLAAPGMMTGAILGMARALGETAPLLMIGMVAFIADVPEGIFDPATVLPVQIYLWADSPERAFVAKMAAGIMVLLTFLIVMNLIAVLLRRRFEQKW